MKVIRYVYRHMHYRERVVLWHLTGFALFYICMAILNMHCYRWGWLSTFIWWDTWAVGGGIGILRVAAVQHLFRTGRGASRWIYFFLPSKLLK